MPSKKDNKRDATARPPYTMLITPGGSFYRSPIASNINDSIMVELDGRQTMRPQAKADGYLTIDEAADTPDQAAALHAYFDMEDREGAIEPLPDSMLPKVCKERRKNTGKPKAVDFKKLVAEAKKARPAED